MDKPTIPDDLNSDDVTKRRAAAEFLSRHQVAAEAILPLVRGAGDEDEQVREWATAALEEMGPPAAAVLDGLIRLLAGGNEQSAYWSATLIGRLGDQGAAAAEPLAAILGGNQPIAVRQRAAWALEKLGPSAACALPALRKAADDPDPRLARQARRAVDAIVTP